MGVFRWVYRRIGQLACFWLGPLFIYGGSQPYSPENQAWFGFALLATGLVLRHQMLQRFYNGAVFIRLTPEQVLKWIRIMTPEQRRELNQMLAEADAQ